MRNKYRITTHTIGNGNEIYSLYVKRKWSWWYVSCSCRADEIKTALRKLVRENNPASTQFNRYYDKEGNQVFNEY